MCVDVCMYVLVYMYMRRVCVFLFVKILDVSKVRRHWKRM